MKSRIIGLLMIMCLLIGLFPTTTLAAVTTTATPSTTGFVMNGQPVSVTQAYTVANTNYLQLRALATLLNGTVSQFNVGWDGKYAVIEPGKAYSGTATATALIVTTDVRLSDTKFKIGEDVFNFAAALLIAGDTNYLQLREFAQKLSGTASQFNVYWDGAAGKAVIQPGVAYTGTVPSAGTSSGASGTGSGGTGATPSSSPAPSTTPTPVKNPELSLYRALVPDGTPFRATPDGAIIGYIPHNTILEVSAINGNWARTTWMGYDCLVWATRIEKVDKPRIVASQWAKQWLSHTGSYIGTAGEWTGVNDDWTRPITRLEMADLLVGIMRNIYGDWVVRYSLPITIKGTEKNPLTDTNDFAANRLAYWGVVPVGKFNPDATVTYGEMTDYLYKLMAYDDKHATQGGRQDFTMADLTKFGIGGNTATNAICTWEQVKVMCDKAYVWWSDVDYRKEANYEANNKPLNDGNGRAGIGSVTASDLYTIKTVLGTKGKQSHMVINQEGKAELSSTRTQIYKINYKGVQLRADGSTMTLCSIQTTDGKFLATSGLPVSGSRLQTQDAEYVWEIRRAGDHDYQKTNVLVSPVNPWQVVNVSGHKTADGTHIISWLWNQGLGSDNNNAAFIFERVQ